MIGRIVQLVEFRSSIEDEAVCGAGGCKRLVTEAVADSLRARGMTAEIALSGARRAAAAVVEGEVLALDEGNRAARYFIGFGTGATRVAIRSRVLDPLGRVIGEFSGERTSTSGKFGGNSEQLLRSTVRDLADDFADRVATGRY